MASSTFHTIVVQAPDDLVHKEALAGGTITPGMLLAWSSGALIPHGSAAGAVGVKMVAVETQTPNADTTAQIDVTYPSGDTVYYVTPRSGDVLNMLLKTGNNASIGSILVSDGAGALDVATVSTTTLESAVVGVAAAALNNTSGSNARLRVEIV